MFFIIFNLLLLSSEKSLCSSTPRSQENISTILLLGTSNEDCQSQAINRAVQNAVASQLASDPISFDFKINTTIQYIEHDSEKVRS